MIPSTHHGQFSGSNRLWFMPGTPAHVSEGTLIVTADRVSVRWAHEGVQKEGEIVLSGPGPSCRGDFTDTFHATTTLVLNGYVEGSAVRLFCTYPAGDGSPSWGWRIVLDWYDPDHFSLRMFNVLPSGKEALSVDLMGARVG